MTDEEYPEIEATVMGHSAITKACRMLTQKSSAGPVSLFAPPVQPELLGRRPTGQVIRREDLPTAVQREAMGVPVVAPPDNILVPKSAAKRVAEELTGCAISMHERDGRKQIEVIIPGNRIEFVGNTWFLALASLKGWADARKRRMGL